MKNLRSFKRRHHQQAFSLVEILVVMAIIGILLGIITFAGFGVMKAAAISRATAEITAMKAALQSYISDNGAPPPASVLTGPPTGNYPSPTSPTDSKYTASSAILYTNLAGKNTYTTITPTGKPYMNFSLNQIGYPTGATYVQDPFGYSYGYSTGVVPANGAAPTQYPNAGPGFFDIWSCGGPTTTATTTANPTASWITSWSN